MNKGFHTLRLMALCALMASSVKGQNALSPAVTEPPHRLALNFRMAFNLTADFHTDLGSSQPLPPPGVSGVDRNYDDGYNRVNDVGNPGGVTHYWGYEHDSQYDAGNHTIAMHSAVGSATANDRSDGSQPGCELIYRRELGHKTKSRWGIETAVNYMNVSIHDHQSGTVQGTRTTDTYQLPPSVHGEGEFVIPPPAPHHGPYVTPGPDEVGAPSIYDSPSARATSALEGATDGYRELDAHVIGWRIGPYVEFPLITRVSFSLSGGFSLVGVISDYRYSETSSDFTSVSGSGSHADLLPGGYASGEFHIELGKGWSALAGAQFQYAGHYTHQEGVSQARLDLSESIFVSLGATYLF